MVKYVCWALDVTGELAVVDTVHPKNNKFVTGVKIKATGGSKLMICGLQFFLLSFLFISNS